MLLRQAFAAVVAGSLVLIPTSSSAAVSAAWSLESEVQDALQALPGDGSYAVSDGVILVDPSVAAAVNDPNVIGTTAVLGPDDEGVVGDPNNADDVDYTAPVPEDAISEAGVEPATEPPAEYLSEGKVAGVEDSTESTAGYTTSTPWAACGLFDSKYKLVKDYSRQMISGVSGSHAHLKCGTENWGYRHIKARHMSHWQGKADMVGGTWRGFADWAMLQVLAKPCTKYRQYSNDTLQYVSPIQIKDRYGRVIHTFGVRVSVARVTQNIVTSYPQSSTCS